MTAAGRPARQGARTRLRFSEELRFLLPSSRRGGEVSCTHDGTSSLGHVVESLSVPLTEVGALTVGGRAVPPSYVPYDGALADVRAVARPQRLPPGTPSPPRFLLDVHLGALARRLRLVGVDTAYRNDSDDDALLARANDERRVLLTQDRGLLRRHALWLGAYVRGSRPDGQLDDVIGRFAPPLAPWSRCLSCNGRLMPVPKEEIADRLPPGTRRTYDAFERCGSCGRLYWAGAHHARLQTTVRAAEAALAAATERGAPGPGSAGRGGPGPRT